MTPVDPFELPAWLGESEVVWTSDDITRSTHLVAGFLIGESERLACDLVAIDEAYPAPVADDTIRTAAHQAWQHGEVLLVEREGRLTLAVPGRYFRADRVLDALTRLARAVGGDPAAYSVRLRLGGARAG
jgi:hypothetical protein